MGQAHPQDCCMIPHGGGGDMFGVMMQAMHNVCVVTGCSSDTLQHACTDHACCSFVEAYCSVSSSGAGHIFFPARIRSKSLNHMLSKHPNYCAQHVLHPCIVKHHLPRPSLACSFNAHQLAILLEPCFIPRDDLEAGRCQAVEQVPGSLKLVGIVIDYSQDASIAVHDGYQRECQHWNARRCETFQSTAKLPDV